MRLVMSLAAYRWGRLLARGGESAAGRYRPRDAIVRSDPFAQDPLSGKYRPLGQAARLVVTHAAGDAGSLGGTS